MKTQKDTQPNTTSTSNINQQMSGQTQQRTQNQGLLGIPYVGSKISLISKSGFRYEGTLYTIDTEESTVALRDVKIFNDSGRVGGDKVYNYIVFKGQDIKDLTVCSAPTPTMPSFDPSMQQPSSGFYGYNYGMPNYNPYMSPYNPFYFNPYMQPRMGQFNQQQGLPRQNLQQQSVTKTDQTETLQQTSNLPPKPQVSQVIQKPSSLVPPEPKIEPNKIVEPTPVVKEEPKKEEKKKEEEKEQPEQQKKDEKKVEPPKYSSVVQGNKESQAEKKAEVKQSGQEAAKPNNQVQYAQKKDQSRRGGRGKFSYQRGRRNYQPNTTRDLHLGTPGSGQTKFTEEFDFQSNLAKFSKTTVEKELKDKVAKGEKQEENEILELPKKAYSKDSFFDNISRDLGEQRMSREERENQYKKDIETFGALTVNQRNQRGEHRFNRHRYNRRSKFRNYQQSDNRPDNRRRNRIFAPKKQNTKAEKTSDK